MKRGDIVLVRQKHTPASKPRPCLRPGRPTPTLRASGEGAQWTSGHFERSGGSSFAAPEPSSVKWACRVAAQFGMRATGRLAACVG